MNSDDLTTNASLAGGSGLALLGTTCCALPIVLVALGMGSVVASVVSALPVLAWLSQYKAATFSLTALVLAYSWWRLRRAAQSGQCVLEDGKHLKWQKWALGINTIIFVTALFAAYALLPVILWVDS